MANPTATARMLNKLCSMTTKPHVLNALHACRPGHPSNNDHQWRNAAWLVAQNGRDFLTVDIWWLEAAANAEAANERAVRESFAEVAP